MKKLSIFIFFSLFLTQLQAQTQDSILWAKDKNEFTIASSTYLAQLLGFQDGKSFQPLVLYKRRITPNKLLRAGILVRDNVKTTDVTQISVKDTIMQIFSNQESDSKTEFHIGIEKQRIFKHNNRFRAMYGCDAVFVLGNEKELLMTKRYIKKNDVYVLSKDLVPDDLKIVKDDTSYSLGVSPLFGVDYRIFNRIYLGGVINMTFAYNFTKKKMDTNLFYTPTLSFRF
jgi:hypothetical protein